MLLFVTSGLLQLAVISAQNTICGKLWQVLYATCCHIQCSVIRRSCFMKTCTGCVPHWYNTSSHWLRSIVSGTKLQSTLSVIASWSVRLLSAVIYDCWVASCASTVACLTVWNYHCMTMPLSCWVRLVLVGLNASDCLLLLHQWCLCCTVWIDICLITYWHAMLIEP